MSYILIMTIDFCIPFSCVCLVSFFARKALCLKHLNKEPILCNRMPLDNLVGYSYKCRLHSHVREPSLDLSP